MNTAGVKSIASIITIIMSFLGWRPADYAKYLSPNIQSEVILNSSPSSLPSPSESKAVFTPHQNNKSQGASEQKSQRVQNPKISTVQKVPTQNSQQNSQSTILQNLNSQKTASSSPIQNTNTPIASHDISKSIVNILCSLQTGNTIEKFTGSGVVIDPNGIILTNAHVAEHVMLSEVGKENCTIRIGSPAYPAYKAKVVYLPPAWINANANNISMQSISGNGENDFALLVLSETLSKNVPNVPLPYIELSDVSTKPGDAITLSGYPAGFGDISLLDSALYLLTKSASITNIFGYDGVSADVIDTSPTSVAERGSSGGAIVGSDGKLVGIIDSTILDSTGSKDVQGISVSYIRKSIQSNSGKSLDYFLSNPYDEANSFASSYAQVLSSALLK